jgi:hypothetical protein
MLPIAGPATDTLHDAGLLAIFWRAADVADRLQSRGVAFISISGLAGAGGKAVDLRLRVVK